MYIRGRIEVAFLPVGNGYSEFEGTQKSGHFFVFAFIYDNEKREINRCYYELTWGDRQRQTFEAEKIVEAERAAEMAEEAKKADSLSVRQASPSKPQ